MRSSAPVKWPDRISGFRSGAINEIIDVLDSFRPINTRTVRHEWRSDGLASHGAEGGGSAAATTYAAIFDLYDVSTVACTFKVRGGTAAASVAGVAKTVTTYDAAVSGAITATSWVFLTVERVAGTAVITVAETTLTASDDDTEIFPLWYIPVTGGVGEEVIDATGIIDYRHSKHILAMA